MGTQTASGIANTPLLKIIDSYKRYFASGESHTPRAKRLDLDHFVSFLQSMCGLSRPEKLKVADWNFSAVQRFVDESLSSGESPATVARRLATIKHMGRTLSEQIPGFINPAREVRTPKVKALRPRALSPRQLEAVRRKAGARLDEKDSFIRIRNRTLFELLIDTGLRADEVRLLKLAQLDEKLEWIRSVKTKGRRFRNVYMTSAIRPALKSYLQVRAAELKRHFSRLTESQSRNLPLFISGYAARPDKPDSFLMGPKTIWRAINELSTDTQLHPHLLRHSYAVDLLDSSNDVRLVAQALGHSDVRVTMRYTERKDEEVARALEKSRKSRSSGRVLNREK